LNCDPIVAVVKAVVEVVPLDAVVVEADDVVVVVVMVAVEGVVEVAV